MTPPGAALEVVVGLHDAVEEGEGPERRQTIGGGAYRPRAHVARALARAATASGRRSSQASFLGEDEGPVEGLRDDFPGVVALPPV